MHPDEVCTAIIDAVVDVAQQLRERGQVARTLTLGIALADSSISRSRTLHKASAYIGDVMSAAVDLFQRMALQRARVREQLDSAAPLYGDLPADPRRLRVIEVHVAQQLRRTGEQLYEVETGDRPWASGPGDSWRLQTLPTAVNRPTRQVLHRAECWIDGGDTLTAPQAAAAAERPNVQPCPLCRPTPSPGPLPGSRSRLHSRMRATERRTNFRNHSDNSR
ncbi:DUF6233 domain-containing protein [Streptomyces sp. NPDC046977]|uniref:DUF6233 domain-containing protein n=1 Tax=Streptomyces sp. NPDC046977 TaxID=3154703 RepID=UPI0033E672FF